MTTTNSPEGNYYSAEQLAELRLPGKPTSKKQWYVVLEAEKWPFREVKSAGRNGMRREYQPPPPVLSMIRKRLLANAFDLYRMTEAVGEPVGRAKMDFIDAYNQHVIADSIDGMDTISYEDLESAISLKHQPETPKPTSAPPSYISSVESRNSDVPIWRRRMTEPWVPGVMADVAMRSIQAINDLPEIPRTISSSHQSELVARLFELLMSATDGDRQKMQDIIAKPESLRGALRLAWETAPKDE